MAGLFGRCQLRQREGYGPHGALVESASCWKPSVAYLVLNCVPLKEADYFAVLFVRGIPYQSLGKSIGALALTIS